MEDINLRFWSKLSGLISLILLGVMPLCRAQNYSTAAPDGAPSATISQDCVTSHFFSFTFRAPDGMDFDDISTVPNGGKDSTGRNFILFKAYRVRGANRDVIDAAAEDRRSANDSSAASWMRALHHWNATRSDVPSQGEVESVTAGDQQFSRLRFQQSREYGVMTYETAYAIGVRGFVVYLIFGSTDQTVLTSMERSIGTFSNKTDACSLTESSLRLNTAPIAQDTKPFVLPERTMAAKLQTYETPALSKPTSAKRCSNALAVVHVVIGTDGKVRSADYVSGYQELKDPALAAVARWSYEPYSVDGKPVVVDTHASVFFLGDGESMPMFVPDGKGGVKGGNVIPLPLGCGPGPQIKGQN